MPTPTPTEGQPENAAGRGWSKHRIGLVGTAVLVVLGLVAWLAIRPKETTPAQRQQEAIELLMGQPDSLKNRRQAKAIALELKESKYQDPDFPGAADFILGIVAFREGLDAEESKKEERFVFTVDALRDAERLALNNQYRPEWAYALGFSLHALGSPAEARPYMEEALEFNPDKSQELTGKLIEIYLELKTPSLIQKALVLAEDLQKTLEGQQASKKEQDLGLLLKAQVLVVLERSDEALETLAKVELTEDESAAIRIVRSQTYMSLKTRRGYLSAKETLQQLVSSSRVTESQARQGYYLQGVCEESLGDTERAIVQYERTTLRYPKTQEGIAASLRLARLLQLAGRDEEALAAYQMALRLMPDPATYHNRWVSIEHFQELILSAWNQWVERNDFTNAISLSRAMPPLFTTIQAGELEARAYEKWAENSVDENASMRLKDPKTYQRNIRERWNASGDAYAILAELLKSSPRYADVLWKTAEHYIRGYRFKKAEEKLERFISTAPKELLPLALVRLAYTRLNNDEITQAQELLNEVIRKYPNDPASYQASYLLGVANLEQAEYEKANLTWREILESSSLDPAAKEWRDSLFALGSARYHVISARMSKQNDLEARLASVDSEAEQVQVNPESNIVEWNESIARLSEFVRRYPEQKHHFEGQYLLARAYQKSAREYQAKLKRAQIANEKQELAKEYHQRLRVARQILEQLRLALTKQEEAGLDEFESRLLQNTYFDLGDIGYAMQEYDSAILAYGSAINRYPDHIRVLLSYLQMSHCYDRIDKPEESRSTLKQAQILAQRMGDDAFQSTSTSLRTRQEWADWFEWMLKMSAN